MDKGGVKRVIVTPDKHFPLHDQPAINCLKKTLDKSKWSHFGHQKPPYYNRYFLNLGLKNDFDFEPNT